jgi:hypothetical protein
MTDPFAQDPVRTVQEQISYIRECETRNATLEKAVTYWRNRAYENMARHWWDGLGTGIVGVVMLVFVITVLFLAIATK